MEDPTLIKWKKGLKSKTKQTKTNHPTQQYHQFPQLTAAWEAVETLLKNTFKTLEWFIRKYV